MAGPLDARPPSAGSLLQSPTIRSKKGCRNSTKLRRWETQPEGGRGNKGDAATGDGRGLVTMGGRAETKKARKPLIPQHFRGPSQCGRLESNQHVFRH